MKVSKEKMAEHRETIVSAAAKRFRERGFDGIGVAELMKEAGLTHGGFYGHFDSKEELMALASVRAMDENVAKWEQIIDSAEGGCLEALAHHYLSRRHRDAAGSGCVVVALGSDMARQSAPIRAALTAGVRRRLDLISRIVPGRTKAARREKAIVVFATMVGAMLLARGVHDSEFSDEILQAAAAALPEVAKEAGGA